MSTICRNDGSATQVPPPNHFEVDYFRHGGTLPFVLREFLHA